MAERKVVVVSLAAKFTEIDGRKTDIPLKKSERSSFAWFKTDSLLPETPEKMSKN
jgi:hypothetical protein